MEATTAIRTINTNVRPLARRKRSTAQPIKKRALMPDQNVFLKHRFLPFWHYGGNKIRAEREFQNSLSILCDYYGLTVPYKGGNFPQNIYTTWQTVISDLKAVDPKLSCIVAEDESHIATLATVKRYDTGMTLYYIPVRPLWQWMQSGQADSITELIIGVFAYLEQVVKIPFYTEQASYLAMQYETLEQWINDDQEEEEPERQKQLDELYTMQNAGIKIYAQIINPENLKAFENVVQNFQPAEDWQKEWQLLGLEFLQLYCQYPDRSVFDHIQSDLLYPHDEDRICADHYISFYWSGNDSIQECLFEMIDNQFQEIAYIDEPAHVQLFDAKPEKTTLDFDYENRLFDLLDKLSRLLNKYDHEQCEPPIQ
jgi:hypothetical protein